MRTASQAAYWHCEMRLLSTWTTIVALIGSSIAFLIDTAQREQHVIIVYARFDWDGDMLDGDGHTDSSASTNVLP
ncbi:hypothetical protein ONZ45_g17357 [Pleurotus djamor]|nr:hypothetical protein ONZ45_g17357 [Pleurotus djamor]